MERMTLVLTELQMRQALAIVLRELAHAIIQALPEDPEPGVVDVGMTTETGDSVPNGRLLITMADAAAMLSISRAAFYRLVMRGQIHTIRIGRSRRVSVSALQEFISRLSREGL